MGKTKRRNLLGQKVLTDSRGVNFKKLSGTMLMNTKDFKTIKTLKYYKDTVESIAFCEYFVNRCTVEMVKRKPSFFERAENKDAVLRKQISITLKDYRKFSGVIHPQWIEKFIGNKVILDNGFTMSYEYEVCDSVFEEVEDYSKIPNTSKDIYYIEQKQYKNKKRLEAAEDKMKDLQYISYNKITLI